MKNVDQPTVEGFGNEWQAFDQSALRDADAQSMFRDYFSMFDFTNLGEGFDLGCGSGRWARLVAPHCRSLHCIDPSDAIDVARRNLADQRNVTFHRASADSIPLADDSQDFGYSLGVLHHIPDPEAALRSAAAKSEVRRPVPYLHLLSLRQPAAVVPRYLARVGLGPSSDFKSSVPSPERHRSLDRDDNLLAAGQSLPAGRTGGTRSRWNPTQLVPEPQLLHDAD